jgi:hypothetical protein
MDDYANCVQKPHDLSRALKHGIATDRLLWD